MDYARMDTNVSDGDEIAFLPPVSGGAPGHARDRTA
jgi:molybdopterin converting factor small subunit